MRSTLPLRKVVVAMLAATSLLLTACLPDAPATGRNTPVRRVLLLGDSLAHGLFFATPSAKSALETRFARNRIDFRLIGGPGSTPAFTWPGTSPWLDQLRFVVRVWDPDVVIIQSTLFPGYDPSQRAPYKRAVATAFDIAQSKGAHTYVVAHHRGRKADERAAADLAERLQAEVARGRGIATIPLNWWIEHCPKRPVIDDGLHLTAAGVECYADAMNAAVNQLRDKVG